MSISPVQYQLPDNWDIKKSVEFLGSGFSTEVEPEYLAGRVFYDSFDWRLYLGGYALAVESRGSVRQLLLSALENRAPLAQLDLTTDIPCFAWDVPDPALRERLAGLLAMRAVIPQVEVRLRCTEIRLLDEERKTVLRMLLEEGRAGVPGKQPQAALGIWLTLMPVKGYGRWLSDTQRYLMDEFDLEEAETTSLEQALAAIGRQPADYSSKLNFSLEPESRADTVAKQIHLHLLNTLELNIAGTKADTDSEFLHDLRVAVRRSRSALTQIKGVFPEQELEHFKSRLSWIGQITGPTRDLDVYLLGFRDYQATLPERFQADLEPLHRFLVAHQKQEHQTLVRKINSPHFRKLLKEWRDFLEAPVPEVSQTASGNAPIKSLADKRIYRMFKRVLKEGLEIEPGSPHEMLHELRKSCKKLRYLLEFFQSLYPEKEVKALVKVLKKLLDNLGDFQDLEVQAFKLREFAHQMVTEGEVPADTLLAMGMLVDGLLRRQQQAREAFSSRFDSFASDENRENYQRLFTAGKTKPEAVA